MEQRPLGIDRPPKREQEGSDERSAASWVDSARYGGGWGEGFGPPEDVEEPAPKRFSGFTPRHAWLGGAVALGLVVLLLVGLVVGNALDNSGSTSPNAEVTVSRGSLPVTDVGKVYRAASPAVVSVQVSNGSGTGFVINSGGTIVTNAHVVENTKSAKVTVRDGSKPIDAQVLGTDLSSDLAVLRVDPQAVRNIKPLPFADSKGVNVGDRVVAIGYPLGLDRTATAGIVSGVGRHIQAPNGFEIDKVIQTDAAINPGNSGGPLLDASGRVIGINSQIATAAGGGNGNIGIGFAVPSNTVRDVIPRLVRGQQIARPFLGVTTATAPAGGALVVAVTAGGPAASAGIQAGTTNGDVIVAVNDRPVRDSSAVSTAIETLKPGDTVKVEVQRGGKRQTLTVTLGTRPNQVPQGP